MIKRRLYDPYRPHTDQCVSCEAPVAYRRASWSHYVHWMRDLDARYVGE